MTATAMTAIFGMELLAAVELVTFNSRWCLWRAFSAVFGCLLW